MKRKNQHFNAAVPMLALILTLSAGTVYPVSGAEGGVIPPLPKFSPTEEGISEINEREGTQPLIDKDDLTTKNTA